MFKDTLALVLHWEGVYDNNPKDPGGETVFGITRVYEPNWEGWKAVEELKAAQVPKGAWPDQERLMYLVTLYYEAVWAKLRLNECPSDRLDGCILGGYVNQGPRVIKWLQEAIAELGVPCVADMVMGPGTITALKAAIGHTGGEAALLNGLLVRRCRAYSRAKPEFISGLFNRVFAGA